LSNAADPVKPLARDRVLGPEPLRALVGALRRRPGQGPQLGFGARWRKVVLVVVALVADAWLLRRLA